MISKEGRKEGKVVSKECWCRRKVGGEKGIKVRKASKEVRKEGMKVGIEIRKV